MHFNIPLFICGGAAMATWSGTRGVMAAEATIPGTKGFHGAQVSKGYAIRSPKAAEKILALHESDAGGLDFGGGVIEKGLLRGFEGEATKAKAPSETTFDKHNNKKENDKDTNLEEDLGSFLPGNTDDLREHETAAALRQEQTHGHQQAIMPPWVMSSTSNPPPNNHYATTEPTNSGRIGESHYLLSKSKASTEEEDKGGKENEEGQVEGETSSAQGEPDHEKKAGTKSIMTFARHFPSETFTAAYGLFEDFRRFLCEKFSFSVHADEGREEGASLASSSDSSASLDANFRGAKTQDGPSNANPAASLLAADSEISSNFDFSMEEEHDDREGTKIGRSNVEDFGATEVGTQTQSISERASRTYTSTAVATRKLTSVGGTCSEPFLSFPSYATYVGLVEKFYRCPNCGQYNGMPPFSALEDPSTTRIVPEIDISDVWVGQDDFAATYEGFIKFPLTGDWQLALESDDGSKLFLDGQLLIDNESCCGKEYSSVINVTSLCPVPIRIEYYEAGGDAKLQLYWKRTDMPEDEDIVPSANLSPGLTPCSLKGIYRQEDFFARDDDLYCYRVSALGPGDFLRSTDSGQSSCDSSSTTIFGEDPKGRGTNLVGRFQSDAVNSIDYNEGGVCGNSNPPSYGKVRVWEDPSLGVGYSATMSRGAASSCSYTTMDVFVNSCEEEVDNYNVICDARDGLSGVYKGTTGGYCYEIENDVRGYKFVQKLSDCTTFVADIGTLSSSYENELRYTEGDECGSLKREGRVTFIEDSSLTEPEVTVTEPSTCFYRAIIKVPACTKYVGPTASPTSVPSDSLSEVPSDEPSVVPSHYPSSYPSVVPSEAPSFAPSSVPSGFPTLVPSVVPSEGPSLLPTLEPSAVPSSSPHPSPSPTSTPRPSTSPAPSAPPSPSPSQGPSDLASEGPSRMPSPFPSATSSDPPSLSPSQAPSDFPSEGPSKSPAPSMSLVPSQQPSPRNAEVAVANILASDTTAAFLNSTNGQAESGKLNRIEDEVANDDPEGALQTVISLMTSQQCSDQNGPKPGADDLCDDLAELVCLLQCEIDNGGCDQKCGCKDGSLACSCSQGYELADDGKSCDANCFETNVELRKAIHAYVCDNTVVKAGVITKYGAIGDWCVSQLTDFSYAFSASNRVFFQGWCFAAVSSFNEDISKWDTSSATTMERMFDGEFGGFHAFNQSINDWDVSNVELFEGMFYDATSFNKPLDRWNTSSATDMTFMFHKASAFNQNINEWDVSNVQTFKDMFWNATSFNKPLDRWNTSSATSMSGMFLLAKAFNQSVNDWDVSNVESFRNMFKSATSFNQPLDDWEPSSATTMESMFSDAFAFNQNINTWDVSNVNRFSYMFYNAITFNQSLDGWEPSSATTMEGMFYYALAFNQSLCPWNNAPLLPPQSILWGPTFEGTDCPSTDSPRFNYATGRWSPLCYDCTTAQGE